MSRAPLFAALLACCWSGAAAQTAPAAQVGWKPAAPGISAHLVVVATPRRTQAEDLPQSVCTGVLVSPQHVLVAGACVGESRDAAKLLDAAALEIYGGAKVDRASKPIAVADVIRHPEFNPLSRRGDLAIVRLAEPVAAPMQPIPFASPDDSITAPVSLQSWQAQGTERYYPSAMPLPRVGAGQCEAAIRDEMMEKAQGQFVDLVKAMQVSPEVAANAWRGLSAAAPPVLAAGMVCGATREGLPCEADNSSVLVTERAGKPQLVGILGSTQTCGTPGLPGVFSTVAANLPWIQAAMAQGSASSATAETARQRQFPAQVAATRLARSGGGTEGSMGSGGTPRIVGGVNAVPGFYPFQVSLILAEVAKGAEFNGFYCGGTRIGEKHILTAAHCMMSKGKPLAPSDVHVYLGHVDFRGGQRIPVARVHLHPGWNSNTMAHDIAVLELERAPEPGALVASIDLMQAGNPYPRRARAIGWGATDFQGEHSRSLRETPMAVIEQAACDETYRSFEARSVRAVISEVAVLMGLSRSSQDKMVRAVTDGVEPRIGQNVICAGSLVGSRSTCQGDSGGPLFSQSADGKPMQIGIVSWGVACDTSNVYGVFTDVSKYGDWIVEVTR